MTASIRKKASRESMDARRRVELARIHVQAKQLGLDEDTYRALLLRETGRESAADLNARERGKVLNELSHALGQKRYAPPYPGRPHNLRSPSAPRELKKIEAFLAESGRPWSYADAIAKRVAKVDCCAWLTPDGARKVLAALSYDARRHGRRTA